MSDNTESSRDAPVVTVEYTQYRGRDTVTEEMKLPLNEVERLLEQMLRGSLDGVDAKTVDTELDTHRIDND